jgi:hypothetical protein
MSRVFGSALSGKSKERPELASASLPLQARISVLPCRGGEGLLRRLEPLGYSVGVEPHPLDEEFPEWGRAPTTRSSWRRIGDHSETHPVRSKGFRRWLVREFFTRYGRPPGTQAL